MHHSLKTLPNPSLSHCLSHLPMKLGASRQKRRHGSSQSEGWTTYSVAWIQDFDGEVRAFAGEFIPKLCRDLKKNAKKTWQRFSNQTFLKNLSIYTQSKWWQTFNKEKTTSTPMMKPTNITREALNTAQMAWRVSSSPQSGENSDISFRMQLLGDCPI